MKNKLKIKLFVIAIISLFMTLSCDNKNEWANMNYYKEANAALNVPEKNENRIVFMGNSITEGWDNHYPIFFRNTSYINRGISGQTTGQMLYRFQQDVIDLKPSVVVILAGTNDIAENDGPITIENIAKNIFSMAEIAYKNDIKVIICAVTPAFDYVWRPGLNPNEKIPELNGLLKAYAEKNDSYYVDFFSAMNDGNNGLIETYGYDGVHPNKEGYVIMESLLKTSISQVLK